MKRKINRIFPCKKKYFFGKKGRGRLQDHPGKNRKLTWESSDDFGSFMQMKVWLWYHVVHTQWILSGVMFNSVQGAQAPPLFQNL